MLDNLFTTILTSFLLLSTSPNLGEDGFSVGKNPYFPQSDLDMLEFFLNLKYLEGEFFLGAASGDGLDKVAPNLTMGGPPPIGVRKANFSPLIQDIVMQFGYQEIGHIRAMTNVVKGFPRPLIDLSSDNFAKIMDRAMKYKLDPPFDPYTNDLNYLLASYIIPYVGVSGYVGSNQNLKIPQAKKLIAGLLGSESAQDAVIRALLYERSPQRVQPYNITVTEFTQRISDLKNEIGKKGVKDVGFVVLGAEGRSQGNIIPGDENSLSYDRTPREILRIVYGTGDESTPGGFFPEGASGSIARSLLSGAEDH